MGVLPLMPEFVPTRLSVNRARIGRVCATVVESTGRNDGGGTHYDSVKSPSRRGLVDTLKDHLQGPLLHRDELFAACIRFVQSHKNLLKPSSKTY
ncbi:protein of unknown function [Pararobbsia alpina]